jgi:predicted aminopeptidase
VLIVLLEGCYYVQAARGQLDMMSKKRPLDEVISDQESAPELKSRLAMVQDARRFSVDELLLPDNDSYQSYADLGRDYVVWNIFAAPEFSLQPKQWCYPIAGCVAYRGYFSEDSARKKAQKLAQQGFDTSVSGIAAYSTLGRFSDPVLNTMMHWSDTDLVATLFHELAHQKLYVKGDTAFNESFATAVADFGLERWLAARGQLDQLDARRQAADLRREIMVLVDAAKLELEGLYASGADIQFMRSEKSRILADLSAAATKKATAASSGRNWLSGDLNNARLASLGLYEGHVGAFRAILRECHDDLHCFYQRAEQLSGLNDDARLSEMQRIKAAAASPSP